MKAASAYQPNQVICAECSVGQLQLRKMGNMKKASLPNKRNSKNSNTQKLKKTQGELKHTKMNNKNKFKVKSIKSENW